MLLINDQGQVQCPIHSEQHTRQNIKTIWLYAEYGLTRFIPPSPALTFALVFLLMSVRLMKAFSWKWFVSRTQSPFSSSVTLRRWHRFCWRQACWGKQSSNSGTDTAVKETQGHETGHFKVPRGDSRIYAPTNKWGHSCTTVPALGKWKTH